MLMTYLIVKSLRSLQSSLDESGDMEDKPLEKAPSIAMPPVVQPGYESSPQEGTETVIRPRYR